VSLQLIAVGTRHCRLLRLLSSVYIIPMQTDLILIIILAVLKALNRPIFAAKTAVQLVQLPAVAYQLDS